MAKLRELRVSKTDHETLKKGELIEVSIFLNQNFSVKPKIGEYILARADRDCCICEIRHRTRLKTKGEKRYRIVLKALYNLPKMP